MMTSLPIINNNNKQSRAERRLRVTQSHLLTGGPSNNINDMISSNECCGIIGFIGKEEAFPYLMEGLSILESRGYDSAGVTTINENNELVTSKFASSQQSTSDAIARLKGANGVCSLSLPLPSLFHHFYGLVLFNLFLIFFVVLLLILMLCLVTQGTHFWYCTH